MKCCDCDNEAISDRELDRAIERHNDYDDEDEGYDMSEEGEDN